MGYTLDEIPNAVTGKTTACFEPTVDYCVLKIPRLPFDKFTTASRTPGHPDEGHRRGHGHRQLLRGGADEGGAALWSMNVHALRLPKLHRAERRGNRGKA